MWHKSAAATAVCGLRAAALCTRHMSLPLPKINQPERHVVGLRDASQSVSSDRLFVIYLPEQFLGDRSRQPNFLFALHRCAIALECQWKSTRERHAARRATLGTLVTKWHSAARDDVCKLHYSFKCCQLYGALTRGLRHIMDLCGARGSKIALLRGLFRGGRRSHCSSV